MSIRDAVTHKLFPEYVDKSHEEIGRHKCISFLFDPQKPTVDLTATSNDEHYSVGTNDDQDKNCQLSNTDEKENYETEDPIDIDKQSSSAAAQIEAEIFYLLLKYL